MEQRKPRLRWLVVWVLAVVWMAVVLTRLSYLQLVCYGEYFTKAQHQQQRVFEISPKRGVIYDRKGRELAISLPMDSVFGDPAEINDPEMVARLLAPALELPADDLFTEGERSAIEMFEKSCCTAEPETDVLKASQIQDKIEAILHQHGIQNGWQYASSLVESGVQPEPLNLMLGVVRNTVAEPALKRVSALVEIDDLLAELENSTSKISDLVRAIKEYSYMDQAPVQDVDLTKGLENTLTIMAHKLKKGVTIKRDYHPTPLLVNSYGSELNQVWTNIIDNAIDAMHGAG